MTEKDYSTPEVELDAWEDVPEELTEDGESEAAEIPSALPLPEAPGAYDPLRRYLFEIGKYGLIDREEETQLAIRYKEKDDQSAAFRLITANLRLVVKIAMEFQHFWMKNLLDLIQEGNVGLMQALRKFDPYRGVKFSYYASFWIKAYILKFIMDNWHLVRVGTTQAQRKLFYNLRKEKDRLVAQGIEPGPKLLSQRLQVSEKEIIEMGQRLEGPEVSLDSPLRDGTEDSHIDFLPSELEPVDDFLAESEIQRLVHEKLIDFRQTLSERDMQILDRRILADKPETLQDMGQAFGVSRERVRQLEEQIKKNIKEYLLTEIPELEGTGLSDGRREGDLALRYEGTVYRPPSESSSLLIQATIGCPHNKCRFCGMYKDKKFRIRPVDEVLEDLDEARDRFGPHVRTLFLPDGSTIVMKTAGLVRILERARANFPRLERTTVYGSARFINLKSAGELRDLARAGLTRIHMGLESGDDVTLALMNKGSTAARSVEAGIKVREAGLELSVYYLVGIGGRERLREHALGSAAALSAMAPEFIRLRTYQPTPEAPLYRDMETGQFQLPSPREALGELELLIQNVSGPSMLLSDHVSNYLNLSGRLPEDKEDMLAEIREALGREESAPRRGFFRR
ncbi:MAG: RNA polymerase factor sigma-32 [Pseudomonadota bacterium]